MQRREKDHEMRVRSSHAIRPLFVSVHIEQGIFRAVSVNWTIG